MDGGWCDGVGRYLCRHLCQPGHRDGMAVVCALRGRLPRVRGRGVGRVRQWEHGGNCTTRRFDMPATRRWEASCSAKPPLSRQLSRRLNPVLTSSHPSRADLRNKLIGVVQIVPSDADNVPALGLEVALAFALAGE